MRMKFSEIVKKMEEDKKTIEILPTGLNAVDEHLDGGFLKKELVVIGAGTGMGKSLVAGQIFKHIAKQGIKSVYFSLEISNQMVASRLMGAGSNISPTQIMIRYLKDDELDKKRNAQADIAVYEEFMDFYDDVYEYQELEKEITTNNYEFIVVDFIQNLMMNKSDEYERLSQIALNLQRLAKKQNCCILMLSQLSNAVTKDKRTNVVEYKGSGSIATVCDLGFFIEESPVKNVLRMRLRKNRRGVSGADFNFTVKQPGGLLVSM